MHKKVRVAVIGAGKLGSRHAEVYSRLESAELVGVCDINETRARQVAGACNTRSYRNYRDLLAAVDAASIVVPSSQHFAISKEFLEHEVHLLIEKPITTRVEEANMLLDLARRRGRIIQVGHIERFNQAIRAIKNVVKNPRFIECHRLGPYDPRVADVGVTLDLMIHDIDIVLDILKSPVRSVDAVGTRILSKTEDIANARVRFENGCVCDLTASRVTPDTVRKIRIFQENAYISLDYVTQEALIYTLENGRIQQKKIEIQKNDSLNEELEAFVDCIRHNKKPLVSGVEARDALALALQITGQICAPSAG